MKAKELLMVVFTESKKNPNKDVEKIAERIIEAAEVKDKELEKFWDMLFSDELTYTSPTSGCTYFWADAVL